MVMNVKEFPISFFFFFFPSISREFPVFPHVLINTSTVFILINAPVALQFRSPINDILMTKYGQIYQTFNVLKPFYMAFYSISHFFTKLAVGPSLKNCLFAVPLSCIFSWVGR